MRRALTKQRKPHPNSILMIFTGLIIANATRSLAQTVEEIRKIGQE